jgi:hypothetical protein
MIAGASSNDDDGAFLVVCYFLGSVVVCFEVCLDDGKTLWSEPTDVVGVTHWGALEVLVSFRFTKVMMT